MDRSNRGSERPRNGAAKGCTKEQDEPRSGQSGQVPRTSAAEDQITRIGAGEGLNPRGSEPRECEPRGSIGAAARRTERLNRADRQTTEHSDDLQANMQATANIHTSSA